MHVLSWMLAMIYATTHVYAYFQFRRDSILRKLNKRQATLSPVPIIAPSEVPDLCTPQCGTILVNSCQDATCMCTNDYNQAMVNCMNCDINFQQPTTQYDYAVQFLLREFEDVCSSLGMPLNSLTVIGATEPPSTIGEPVTTSPPGTGTTDTSSPTPTDTADPGAGATSTPATTRTTISASTPTGLSSPSSGGKGNGAVGGSAGVMTATLASVLMAGVAAGLMKVLVLVI